MFKPNVLKIYRRLVMLMVLVACLVFVTMTPTTKAVTSAKASSQCCGPEDPFDECENCIPDAMRSCRVSCGGTIFSWACVAEFYCDDGSPNQYICVCGTPTPDSCNMNLCP